MSKAKTRWKRLFGLPLRRWKGRDRARRALPTDCETVVTRPALREAGVRNATRALRALLGDPRFHHYEVILPDGRTVLATHPTSLSWLAGVQHAENRERSLGNLKVGDRVLETIVTKQQQGSRGPAFEPEIWRVPVAPPRPRPSAPLREARRRPGHSRLEREADRAVAVVPRNDDPELEKEMLNQLRDDARRLLTTNGPLNLAAIAAGLRLSTREGRVALARALRNTDDTIIGVPGEGEGHRLLYHVLAP